MLGCGTNATNHQATRSHMGFSSVSHSFDAPTSVAPGRTPNKPRTMGRWSRPRKPSRRSTASRRGSTPIRRRGVAILKFIDIHPHCCDAPPRIRRFYKFETMGAFLAVRAGPQFAGVERQEDVAGRLCVSVLLRNSPCGTFRRLPEDKVAAPLKVDGFSLQGICGALSRWLTGWDGFLVDHGGGGSFVEVVVLPLPAVLPRRGGTDAPARRDRLPTEPR